jgi:hypothetical protein
MILFEILNMDVGDSYVRCYAWAHNQDEATRMAEEKGVDVQQIIKLFESDSQPFVTELSDVGWEMKE